MSQEQTEAKLVEQTEAKLVEQITEVAEVIKKVNEALKDSEIDVLCKRLDAYGKALNAVIKKKHYMFKLHFDIVTYSEYKIQLYVDDEYVYTVYVPLGTTIDALFEKVFTSQGIKTELTNKIYDVLSELAREIADKADIVRRVEEIEKRLREDDP